MPGLKAKAGSNQLYSCFSQFNSVMNNVIASVAKQSRLETPDFLLARRDCFAALAMTPVIPIISTITYLSKKITELIIEKHKIRTPEQNKFCTPKFAGGL